MSSSENRKNQKRLEARVSDEAYAAAKSRASRVNLKLPDFLRYCIEIDPAYIDQAVRLQKESAARLSDLRNAMLELSYQFSKYGTNLNTLAKHANAQRPLSSMTYSLQAALDEWDRLAFEFGEVRDFALKLLRKELQLNGDNNFTN